jgi:hypothetical protein
MRGNDTMKLTIELTSAQLQDLETAVQVAEDYESEDGSTLVALDGAWAAIDSAWRAAL